MKPQLVLLAASALTGFALAQADPHHPENAPATQNSMQMPMNGQGMMQMMQGMMGQMGMMGQGLMMLQGAAFEQAFLSMMVPHHRSAVTMARDILSKTQDAQIREWANAIIRDQEREINQMRTLLGALGGTNLAAQSAMTQGMSSMQNQGMGNMQNQGRGNMQNQGMGAMQTPQTPASPERAFLGAMIAHHLQAVEMATLALQKAQNPAIVKLASDIVVAQAREIYQMRIKLASMR